MRRDTPRKVSAEAAARIAATDHAALMKRRDSRAATGQPPAIPAKFKVAVRIMLAQPKEDIDAAAAASGLEPYMLRRYLGRAECRQYLREQKKIEVDAAPAGNPAALKDVRDNSTNAMARVNATRALELMQQEMDAPKHGSLQSPDNAPGITIVIQQRTPAATDPPTIDVTPEPPEPPHHWPSVD